MPRHPIWHHDEEGSTTMLVDERIHDGREEVAAVERDGRQMHSDVIAMEYSAENEEEVAVDDDVRRRDEKKKKDRRGSQNLFDNAFGMSM